jgi:LysM repeat protein
LSDIAERYETTIDEIMALNPGLDPELITPDQVLLVPAATPEPGAGATPDAFEIHVVESGETLIAIAEAYGVPLELIRTANDLAPDAETIRTGQSLIIPQATPTLSASPTAIPAATSTPDTRYAAPLLLYPADEAVFAEGEAPVLLQWTSVSLLRDDEWYQLSLSQPGGGVVSSTVRTRATAWRVPLDLLERVESLAPEFRWYVQVVREVREQTYEEAGAPSTLRTFVWRAPTASPPPPSTATP